MVYNEDIFTCEVSSLKGQQNIAVITVPIAYVDSLYGAAVNAQKNSTKTYGFLKGNTPISYIEENFKIPIIDHAKELLFNHCVFNFLNKSIIEKKLLFAGEPSLVGIDLSYHNNALFKFAFTKIPMDQDSRWKKQLIKAPERKNYKDLDKQAEIFIKTEQQLEKEHSNHIAIRDTIFFELSLLDNNKEPLLGNYSNQLWLKLNDEESDKDIHQLFLGKAIGDSFIIKSNYFQKYLGDSLNIGYLFHILILDIVPASYFSLDQLKSHFQLEYPNDIHMKLIEVFSYRNDISLRRETVESVLRMLLKQYFVILPNYLLEKQEANIVNTMHLNPDYNVYKAQQDFTEKVKLLAEKQLKETVIIDSIAYQENIQVTHQDIASYLNFLKRPRTKEFLYFDLPLNKSEGQEMPISNEYIRRFCLREKTLNYIISNMTRK